MPTESLLTEAKSCLEKGDLHKGIALCGDAINLDENSFKAYFNRGLAFQKLGEQRASIDDLTHALRIDPHSFSARYLRGLAYHRMDMFTLAERDFAEAVQLAPDSAKAWYYLARAQAAQASAAMQATSFDGKELQKNGQAIKNYSEAIKRKPAYPQAYYHRGLVYLGEGKYNEAINDFTQALVLDPNMADALVMRGSAKQDSGHSEEALADFDAAIRADSNHALAYHERATLQYKLAKTKQDHRRISQAQSDFETAHRLEPALKIPEWTLSGGNSFASTVCPEVVDSSQNGQVATGSHPVDSLSGRRPGLLLQFIYVLGRMAGAAAELAGWLVGRLRRMSPGMSFTTNTDSMAHREDSSKPLRQLFAYFATLLGVVPFTAFTVGLTINSSEWFGVLGSMVIIVWLLVKGHVRTTAVCGILITTGMLMKSAFVLAFCIGIIILLTLLIHRVIITASLFAILSGLIMLGAWVDGTAESKLQDQQVSQPQDEVSPLERARQNLEQLEGRRAAVQDLLDKTNTAQYDVVDRMRKIGIETNADLKQNAQGRILVNEFEQLVGEVRGLEQAIVRINTAMSQTRALLRNLERSKVLGEAGLSDDELKELNLQLRLAEEAESGEMPSVSVDPTQMDELLRNALANP